MKKYLEFVDSFSEARSPIPCSKLAKTMKISSIQNYISGLNFFQRLHDEPSIDYKTFVLTATSKGIRRAKGDAPRQARPLLPDMLRKIFSLLTNNPGHVSWHAAVLCSFRELLRKSQVTDSETVLKRGDFRFYDWGIVLVVRHSVQRAHLGNTCSQMHR